MYSHFNVIIKIRTVIGDLTSTILQSQSLELVIVIVVNVVIDGFSGEDFR